MKLRTIAVLAVVLNLPTPIFAAEEEQQGMMQMHQHMEKMQSMMAEIEAEQDPAKRHALMQQHHTAMHEGMGMMEGGGEMQGMSMEQRMDAMEQRMGMMRMMMDQMLQHENAESTDSADEHQH